VVLPVIFSFLLCGFTLQLVCAVITDSVGWTIGVVVAGNVAFNLFILNFNADPTISEAMKSQTVTWPPLVLQVLLIEWFVIIGAIALALYIQTHKRDLV
jgi:hypothetical protein